MTKTKVKEWDHISEELMCEVVEIRYMVAEKVGRAILRDGHCTDMCGAIRFFQRIDPGVCEVRTFGGSKGNSVYVRTGDGRWHPGIIGEWESVHPAR